MHENWFKELKKNKLHKIARIKKSRNNNTRSIINYIFIYKSGIRYQATILFEVIFLHLTF